MFGGGLFCFPMPYSNVPDNLQDKMHRCVQQAMDKGYDKQAAIAICYTSVVGKEQCGFAVFKARDDSYRWLILATNSYRDSDGEIVAQKALEVDVARMDATGDYGPLRWWHVGSKAGPGAPGLDIGRCDFVAMHGRMRIDSGTFASKEIGEAVAQHAPTLAASAAFLTPGKDGDGAYQVIRSFERSLLPRNAEGNPFTFVSAKEASDMAIELKQKWDAFVKTVFGGDEAKAKEFAAGTEAVQKQIEDAGVEFKEKKDDTAPPVPPAEPPTEQAKEEQPKAEQAAPPVTKEGAVDGAPAGEMADEPMTIGDLTAEQFMGMLGEALKPVLAEVAAMKEAGESVTKERNVLKGRVDALEAELKKLVADQPLTVRAFVASQDASTATPAAKEKADKAPGLGDVPSVVDFILKPVK